MLSVLVFAAAVAAPMPNLAAHPVPPAARSGPACENLKTIPAEWRREARELPPTRRLGDLPRARLERTVLRQVGGCTVPVIIRYEGEAALADR
jgi:hypothetical protein